MTDPIEFLKSELENALRDLVKAIEERTAAEIELAEYKSLYSEARARAEILHEVWHKGCEVETCGIAQWLDRHPGQPPIYRD